MPLRPACLAACMLVAACGGGSSSSSGTPVAVSTTTPPATPTPVALTSPSASSAATVGGCTVFPSNHPWNTDVSSAPVDPNSATYLAHMNPGAFLHPDFGSNPAYGIPYVAVPGSQPFVPMSFDYASESDPGPYPFPSNAPIEGGANGTGDSHVLVVDSGNCTLYEAFSATYLGPGWHAGSGAVFSLSSNALRPDYWTSADAAGLAILPGLVRYDEVQTGAVNHAIRFTVRSTQRAFIHPATHYASSITDPGYPPMGLRVRLKSSFNISAFNPTARTILTAMQRYGMLLADNGSDWFFQGSTDSRWDDNELNALKAVPASAFEVVQTGAVIH